MNLILKAGRIGWVKDVEMEIPIPGATVFYGSNIAGKTLIGILLASTLTISTVTSNRALPEVLGEEHPLALGLKVLSDVNADFLKLWGVVEGFEERSEGLNRAAEELRGWMGDALTALRLYTILSFLSSTLREAYGVTRPLIDVEELELSYGRFKLHLAKARIPLPLEDAERARKTLLDVRGFVEGDLDVIGLTVVDPYAFGENIARIVRGEVRGFRSPLYTPISSMLEKAWLLAEAYSDHRIAGVVNEVRRSISRCIERSVEASVRALEGVEGMGVGASIQLDSVILELHGVRRRVEILSKGLKSLLTLANLAIPIALISYLGLKPLLYLDEPEASIDSISVRGVAELAKHLSKLEGSTIVSTHREDVIGFIERSLDPEMLRLYELLFDRNLDVRVRKAEWSREVGRFILTRLPEVLTWHEG